MKTVTLIVLLSILTLFSLAQDSAITIFKITDYSLRDYVAPDIRFRQLNVSSDLAGSGGQFGESDYSNFNGNGRVAFNNYTNLKDFQGRAYTAISGGLYTSNNSNIDQSVDYYYSATKPNLDLRHSGSNRWYNERERFMGVHPAVVYKYSNENRHQVYDTVDQTYLTKNHEFFASVILSVGTGRIQPVSPARKAMDVLISLNKFNRLAKGPQVSDIDSLAKIVNTIQYKRFYDSRFKRIYQLEELDKGIQGLGLVDTVDMIYAANLSDVLGYGRNYKRGSGSRFEVGAIPVFRYDYSGGEANNQNSVSEHGNYGVYGFASWLKQVPLSFKWQSDFSVGISAGIGSSPGYESRLRQPHDTVTVSSEMINVGYQLGFYPNTRTSFSLSSYASISATQTEDTIKENTNTENIGLNVGLDFSSYYYVSPRFRLAITARTSFVSDGYENQSVLPNWKLTDSLHPIWLNENLSGNNDFRYNYNFTMSYAIF